MAERGQYDLSDDARNVMSDPGFSKPGRKHSNRFRRGYSRRRQQTQWSDSKELTPRRSPTASQDNLASPRSNVSNTSLNVDQGAVAPAPEIQVLEASLGHLDGETQNSDSATHTEHGLDEENIVDPVINDADIKVCKLPPFTPRFCITHPRFCVALYIVIAILLAVVFFLVAALMLAWGFQTVEHINEKITLSGQETGLLNPMNYGLFYHRVCFQWNENIGLFLGRAECSRAFSNNSVISQGPFNGSLMVQNKFTGLKFYWLKDTAIMLRVETKANITSFHLLQDDALSGTESLQSKCRELTPDSRDIHVVKQSYLLEPNSNEANCTEISDGMVECEIEIPSINSSSHNYLCFTSVNQNATIDYSLSIEGPVLDFDSFEQTFECRSEVTGQPCCLDYQTGILSELAHPTCMFARTNASNGMPNSDMYPLDDFTTDIRKDIFWFPAIAVFLIIVVLVFSTGMLISVCCKLRNDDLKGWSCRRMFVWSQYGRGYEQL